MEIEILDPLIYFVGYLVVFLFYGGFMSLIILVIYSFFRSLWGYFKKIDKSINANLSMLSNVELFTIVIICGIASLFLIWHWHNGIAWFAFMFGIIFSMSIPFVLLAYESPKKMTVIIKITLSIFLLLCL